MIELFVDKLEDSIRIDKYIKQIFPSITQSVIEKSIRLGNIKVNNLRIKSSNHKLENEFLIELPNFINKNIANPFGNFSKINHFNKKINKNLIDNVKKSIIFEDENIICINKSGGIACQGGTNLTHSIDQLFNIISETKIRIVHRIDKDTSGLLLLAKNLKYAQILTKLFRENKIKKTYHAICEQEKRINNHMTNEYINDILNKKTITFKSHLGNTVINGEEKMSVNKNQIANSISNITLIKKMQNNLFLFEINPITGKKHQIRAHLQHLSFPILGDRKYNYSKLENKLFLNATKIEIQELDIKIECDLPKYFLNYIENKNFQASII